MWFGGSNAQWLNRLDAKDAALIHSQKDLKEVNEELRDSLKEIGNLKAENVQLRNDLKTANDKLLDILGKRDLRGAVEYISSLVATSNPNHGVQQRLDSLEQHTGFMNKLDNIGHAQQLRKFDMIMCLKKLYHVLSKDMHGKGPPGLVISADIFAPCEVAVLVALFEQFSVSYEVRDIEGNVVSYITQAQAGP